MLQVLITAVLSTALWEFLKAWRRQYLKNQEFERGLRWKCPDCVGTEFGSNKPEVVMHMIVDHDAKFHPEKGHDDAQG
jgi:hypothetical protein